MRDRPPTTLLELKIRERGMTLGEFVQHAEEFARDHGEPGTISMRHLQRLISPMERPASLRPATRRLLEAIFDTSAVELLGPPQLADLADDGLQAAAHHAPTSMAEWEHQSAEVARLVALSGRIDQEALDLLASQVENTRRLDRRFGAAALLGALRLHAEHIEYLLMYATDAKVRRSLAAVLTDAHALAGWQSLDRGEIVKAWRHYAKSCDAAMATGSTPLYALALAKQAVVLSDIGGTAEGAEVSGRACEIGRTGSALVRSWLAAAHGEALAADSQRAQCLHAFDRAHAMLPADCAAAEGPYIGLDAVHLARWRGNALARIGDPEAVPVLTDALRAHDAEFTRAEAGLRVDLVLAHLVADDTESAAKQRQKAIIAANSVGSVRQRRRLADMSAC